MIAHLDELETVRVAELPREIGDVTETTRTRASAVATATSEAATVRTRRSRFSRTRDRTLSDAGSLVHGPNGPSCGAVGSYGAARNGETEISCRSHGARFAPRITLRESSRSRVRRTARIAWSWRLRAPPASAWNS